MANFPTSLDTYTANVDNVDVIYAADVNGLQEAVVALEGKVGIDGSAVTTTHDYKLSAVTGSNKAVPNNGATIATPTITGATITTSTINGVTITTAGAATDFLAANGTYQPGGIANGSTTVKGIFEAATSAEVTAGTATGGTGAVLVVTPDALAASTPTFSGLGITNSVRLTRLAGYATATNTTENTVYTTSIGANLLSTNGMIRVKTPWTATTNTNAETFTIRLKYGGSTLASLTHTCNAVGGGTNSTYNGVIEATIVNNAATNSQNVTFAGYGGILWTTASNLTPNNLSGNTDTTSAIDTTSSQTLTMTVQRTTGGANIASGTFLQTTVETIKNV